MKNNNENFKMSDRNIDMISEVSDVLILSKNFKMKKIRLLTENGCKEYTLKRTKKGNLILN